MPPTTAQLKILIIEDESALLKALTRQFINEGFQVAQARNGEEGIALAHREIPDVIILDILMPVMDGREVLRVLKVDPMLKQIPVIVATNLGDITKGREYLNAGAAHVYIKSDWKLADLVSMVKESLPSMLQKRKRSKKHP